MQQPIARMGGIRIRKNGLLRTKAHRSKRIGWEQARPSAALDGRAIGPREQHFIERGGLGPIAGDVESEPLERKFVQRGVPGFQTNAKHPRHLGPAVQKAIPVRRFQGGFGDHQGPQSHRVAGPPVA